MDWAFDGQFLTEVKHRIKQQTRYQLAAEGQKIEPMRLGKGPFPLPFGQKVEEVVKYFDVTSRGEVRRPKGHRLPQDGHVRRSTRTR